MNRWAANHPEEFEQRLVDNGGDHHAAMIDAFEERADGASDLLEVKAISDTERAQLRSSAMSWLSSARQHVVWAIDDLENSGDSEQLEYSKTVRSAVEDAVESMSEILGAKHE